MANIRLIKGRIKSAKNISQITKAMELVSASKMKKAQQQALSGRTYAQKIFELVMNLASKTDSKHHPLLEKPGTLTGKRLVIVVSTNKGMCGGLNASLFRFLLTEYSDQQSFEYVTVGKKGANFVAIMKRILKADFSDSLPFVSSVAPLAQMAIDAYTSHKVDAVDLVYNDFYSVLKQVPRKKTILPLSIEVNPDACHTQPSSDFVIEPDVNSVFSALLPHYLENQIRDAILEGEASEHSARMIAMRNATDNALSFIQELTLMYNKARQEKITYEISDLTTARSAIVS